MVLSRFYSPNVVEKIESWFRSWRVLGFDCGNKALGVALLEINPVQILPPRIKSDGLSLEERVRMLEAAVADLGDALRNIIRVNVDVWDLLPGVNFKNITLNTMDTAAKNLKAHLSKIPRPDIMVYEFQMNINDKSRTISQYLRYHYCDVCPVMSVGGGLKNTVTLHPQLDHRIYLKRNTDRYKANKQHCADSLLWWASKFDVDISHLPAGVLKDAGDAMMELLALIKHRRLQL